MSDPTLDIENHSQLSDYLRRRDPSCEPAHFQTLAGGVSNRTVLVRFADGQSWVIKQALAKLRTSADWFSDPARVHREALGMRWLTKLAPPGAITEFIFEDFEHHLLAMQAVPEPHENWKTMLMAADVKTEHVKQFATLLAAIHRGAVESEEPLREIFSDRSFFESLRLEPYYQYAATQVPQAAEFLSDLISATRSRQLTLVHGDYSPKNILVHDDQLVLLDHEVIHWGDPAFDLGFALTHLLAKLAQTRNRRFFDVAMMFCDYYAAFAGPICWNKDAEAAAVRHTLACILARVVGRSPLEYLDGPVRTELRRFVLQMINRVPETLDGLLILFIMETGPYADH